MDESEKKMLLEFFTGSDRVPVGGLARLKPKIQSSGPDSDRLPTGYFLFYLQFLKYIYVIIILTLRLSGFEILHNVTLIIQNQIKILICRSCEMNSRKFVRTFNDDVIYIDD